MKQLALIPLAVSLSIFLLNIDSNTESRESKVKLLSNQRSCEEQLDSLIQVVETQDEQLSRWKAHAYHKRNEVRELSRAVDSLNELVGEY
ncbi:MAG: hypothetical protein HWE14_04275 [Flavobacteriia bacterium]|nr:hypothetical protein [Flavobacteriia bacterium]